MVELPGPVVFIDGECVICHRSARFLMQRDAQRTLRYATLQGETAAALRAALPAFPTDLDTVVVAEPDAGAPEGVRLHLRSDGILRSLDLTGGRTLGARLVAWLPRALRDLGYRAIIRFRYRLFGRKDHCSLPSATERSLLLP